MMFTEKILVYINILVNTTYLKYNNLTLYLLQVNMTIYLTKNKITSLFFLKLK